MGKRMTTGETRGLIAAVTVMAIGVFVAAWSSGRFSKSESDDAVALELPSADSLASDSVVTVTIGKRSGERGDGGSRKSKGATRHKTNWRSPLDEPVKGE